jgi:hypothetical protein
MKTYTSNWYEFTPTWSGFDIKYHVAGYFSHKPMLQIYFIWGKIFLYLPWIHYKKIEIENSIKDHRKYKLKKLTNKKIKIKKKYKKILYDQCEPPQYGIYICDNQLCICYGEKTKLYDFPWSLAWIRTSFLTVDGKWINETANTRDMNLWDENKWKNIIMTETYPYTYITKNNTIQECLATIKVEEREWRWKSFKWLKLTRKIRKDINVSFNSEIGEKKGSWKGGVLGCSYEMRYNETPYQTLKRMEKERKFT